MKARNSAGISLLSSVTQVLAAQPPSKPSAPTTRVVGDSVMIKWTAPYAGGSPITSYTIKIRETDEITFTEYIPTCNGADPTVMTNLECSIPVSVLRASPFGHPWGSEIFAKVAARNIKGISSDSDQGNGAIIQTLPDAPNSLMNSAAQSSGTTIVLVWNQGADGGAAIIGYRLSYDAGTGTSNFIVLAAGITGRTYSVTGLTPGVTYAFKV